MEASHKTHRPHMKVGKDEEKKKKYDVAIAGITASDIVYTVLWSCGVYSRVMISGNGYTYSLLDEVCFLYFRIILA